MEKFSLNPSDWKEFIDKNYVDGSISNINNSILNVDSSISLLKDKTSEIIKTGTFDDSEQIILSTDDNIEITSIGIERINDDSEILEFKSESNDETYAKIGTVDGSSGIFVNNIYDLNGNPYPVFQFDSSNDILIISGKKYKMIPIVEET